MRHVSLAFGIVICVACWMCSQVDVGAGDGQDDTADALLKEAIGLSGLPRRGAEVAERVLKGLAERKTYPSKELRERQARIIDQLRSELGAEAYADRLLCVFERRFPPKDARTLVEKLGDPVVQRWLKTVAQVEPDLVALDRQWAQTITEEYSRRFVRGD